jgi:hypothetical protein
VTIPTPNFLALVAHKSSVKQFCILLQCLNGATKNSNKNLQDTILSALRLSPLPSNGRTNPSACVTISNSQTVSPENNHGHAGDCISLTVQSNYSSVQYDQPERFGVQIIQHYSVSNCSSSVHHRLDLNSLSLNPRKTEIVVIETASLQ